MQSTGTHRSQLTGLVHSLDVVLGDPGVPVLSQNLEGPVAEGLAVK